MIMARLRCTTLHGVEIHPDYRRRANPFAFGLRIPDLLSAGGVSCRGLQARSADGGESL